MKDTAAVVAIMLLLGMLGYFIYRIANYNPPAMPPEASPSPLIIKTSTLPQVPPQADCGECKG